MRRVSFTVVVVRPCESWGRAAPIETHGPWRRVRVGTEGGSPVHIDARDARKLTEDGRADHRPLRLDDQAPRAADGIDVSARSTTMAQQTVDVMVRDRGTGRALQKNTLRGCDGTTTELVIGEVERSDVDSVMAPALTQRGTRVAGRARPDAGGVSDPVRTRPGRSRGLRQGVAHTPISRCDSAGARPRLRAGTGASPRIRAIFARRLALPWRDASPRHHAAGGTRLPGERSRLRSRCAGVRRCRRGG